MSTITNNIFSSVKMLADKAVTSYKTDRSVVGTIVSIQDVATGEYGVEYNSIIITAKSIGNEQYNIKDKVYLLIPDNDFENTKFILGLSTKNSSNLTEENPIDKQFNLLGSGVIFNKYLINSDSAFTPTISNTEGIKLYSYNGSLKETNLDYLSKDKEEQLLEDIATLESKLKNDTTAFVVSAKIKTNFTSGDVINGAFGIKVKIKYTDGEREYKFSSSQIQVENVYQMLDYTEQKAAFENINNETFEYISEISVYSDLSQAYLYIKDLKLYGAKRIASFIPTYTLSIESINDLIDISQINKNNNGANIILRAVLKDSKQRVIQNTTYTWYQENVTVADGTSEKGGEGWARIDSDGDNELKINSDSQFTSTSCRFKCIATTSSGLSFDAYYTLINSDGINLSLIREDNELICQAKQGEAIVDSGLKYQWQRKLNNSSTWIDIDNESSSQDVTPSDIYISETYRCTVSRNNEYIGYVETKVYNPQYENVRTIELYYMRSDSHTVAPPAEGEGANWQKTIPEETEGKIWVWQKTVTIYEDGREVVNSIVQIKGIQGEKGEDGVGQKEQLFLYAYTNTDEMPVVPSFPVKETKTTLDEVVGKLSNKDLIYSNGFCKYINDEENKYPVVYTVEYNEETGIVSSIAVTEGDNHPEDHDEIESYEIYYRKAIDPWQFNTQPVTKDLPYQWKYTFIIYTDDTYVTDGPTLESTFVNVIKSIETRWIASSEEEAPDNNNINWTDEFEKVVNTNEKYIWTQEVIEYKSGPPEYTQARKDTATNAIRNWAITTDQTYINGAKIYTGTVSADKIDVNDLSAFNATIGGWKIGKDSIYALDQSFLISAASPDDDSNPVQRIAAGPSGFVNDENNEIEEIVYQAYSLVDTFTEMNYADLDADGNLVVYYDDYSTTVEIYDSDGTKLSLGYTEEEMKTTIRTTIQSEVVLTANNILQFSVCNENKEELADQGDWKLIVTQGTGSYSYDIIATNDSLSVDKLNGYSLCKIAYNAPIKKIDKPVFELLSDGSGSIGGWEITQDGLSKDNFLINTSEEKKETSIVQTNTESTIALQVKATSLDFIKDKIEFKYTSRDAFEAYYIYTFNIPIKISLQGAKGQIHFSQTENENFEIGKNTGNGVSGVGVSSYEESIGQIKIQASSEPESDSYGYIVFDSIPVDAEFKVLYDGSVFATGLTSNSIISSNIFTDVISTISGNGVLKGTWKDINGNLISSSDQRLKNSIFSIPEKYSKVFDKLHPVIFKYNDGTSNRFHIGFIAQEVAQAVEEAGLDLNEFAAVTVGQNDGDFWGIRYGEFAALNVFEIQQLKARAAALEAQNQSLKGVLKALIAGNKDVAISILSTL